MFSYGQLWNWLEGNKMTKDESGYVGNGHRFEGLVIQGERFDYLVGNREPLKGFVEE